MKKLFLLFLLSKTLILHANDGSFTISGNHLVPVKESSISIEKEILSIKRINGNKAIVNVLYEFMNPGDEKIIKVGFEAIGPSGDVNGFPVDGRHPYMYNFTVNRII